MGHRHAGAALAVAEAGSPQTRRHQLAETSQGIGGRRAKCSQAWVIRTQDPVPIGAKIAD